MTESTVNPLVSIIVRTKDRPKLLMRALRSIAAETYRPIEVVVANDGGCPLDAGALRSVLGDVSLSYLPLEQNTGRAHAGNVGIRNAKGEYVGFLDDDDEFYPEHLGTLVAALGGSGFNVAYAAVEFVDEVLDSEGTRVSSHLKGTFATPFSYDDLLIGNYIPLISLLFRTAALRSLMFDESFELYEDWDMLIRAAEAAPFLFVDKITSAYYQRDDSQMAFKSPPEVLREATIKLYEKHRAKLPLGIVFTMREKLYRKDGMIAQKEARLRELEVRVDDLEGVALNLRNILQERDSYIQSIHATRGWRLLTRSYRIGQWFLRLMGWRTSKCENS
ncbi:MAG TPA: glycosyltransferase [Thermodesulfovibrionales bacterium]|nr:glycosyltransferase [Thermodesulfovibrionales bacterium]